MRNLILSVAILSAAGMRIAGAPSAPRPGVDWPQFRGIAATQDQVMAIGKK